jgi:hypothetical protein
LNSQNCEYQNRKKRPHILKGKNNLIFVILDSLILSSLTEKKVQKCFRIRIFFQKKHSFSIIKYFVCQGVNENYSKDSLTVVSANPKERA